MGVSCWVKGCCNGADNSVRRDFYSIPTVRENEGDFTKTLSEDRRRLWLANINRKDAPTKYSKICSDHFINGKPSSMYERSNPDWAPTLLLGEDLTPSKSLKKEKKIETNKKRYQRKLDRDEVQEKHHVARALIELQSESPEIQEIFTAVPLASESTSKPPNHSVESELLESPSTP
ncbi:uncharacterized protein LOC127864990 [Dreissena polymorpha]|uniref:uncharacterized protein LOC127864990 n=1 Tax=Dreissena polymorpha TaxID=45954 RepID=UPI002264776D|nr:uncharacterized protein LOC127864990 [Dreissena polymorpha]